jgi:hypothetical protein
MQNSSVKPVDKNNLRPAPGFTWEVVCLAVVFLTALAMCLADVVQIVTKGTTRLVLLVIGPALLLLTTFKLAPVLANRYRERQRSVVRSAEAEMTEDPRPPVLYLRSFKDDERIARAIGFYSIEQEMKQALLDIGPFIAMAEPDKQEPRDPGAARMRLPQNAWQHKVSEEMSRAALVIMRIGDTPGFWWEMQEAAERMNPERLVLLIPAEDEELYEVFRQKAAEWLPCQLPEYKRRKGKFSVNGGMVYFERDWTPHLQRFKVAWIRQTFLSPFTAMLKIAMKPVYQQLGVEWTKPGVSPSQLIFLSLLCLLMVLVICLFYVMFNDLLSLLSTLIPHQSTG